LGKNRQGAPCIYGSNKSTGRSRGFGNKNSGNKIAASATGKNPFHAVAPFQSQLTHIAALLMKIDENQLKIKFFEVIADILCV
jgi:hypothetical protein